MEKDKFYFICVEFKMMLECQVELINRHRSQGLVLWKKVRIDDRKLEVIHGRIIIKAMRVNERI